MSFDPQKSAAELAPGGRLANTLPGYEPRDEQVRMARAVGRTLRGGGILVVEAETGTGKSLAYLVPAIRWALENEERVIVSTRTINLQEQLVGSELPFLSKNLGAEFRATLVKGRGNYLCLRKALEVSEQPALLIKDAVATEIRTLVGWSRETADGSLAELGFVPHAEAWEAVRAEHDDCLRKRCPEFDDCFFYRARRAAQSANILIVNHSLLMADLALRSALEDPESAGVLPRASRLVIDEAHHLEDVSTDHFGGRITLRRLEQPLMRLQNPRAAEKGILRALLDRLVSVTEPDDRPVAEGAARWIEERLRPVIEQCLRSVSLEMEALIATISPHLPEGQGDERQLRVLSSLRETPLWTDVHDRIVALVAQLRSLLEDVAPVLDRLDDLSEANAERCLFLRTQLEAQTGRLLAATIDLERFTGTEPEICRWFSVRSQRDRDSVLTLSFAPIDVGDVLEGSLFGAFESIIMTSATLTVSKRFDYFFERSGLAKLKGERVETLRLASPFDFSGQALVAIPEDLPEPDQPGYADALHDLLADSLLASRGGAFVLFTSYASLDRAWKALVPRLREAGLTTYRQGELVRAALLDRFRRTEGAVLFATDSFWEGVDVRGDRLRLVAIARLPFRVPTEAVQQSRMEAVEARGGNSFGEYVLPQAVIKLRQGFGRLIRSRDDTGAVLLLDSRIVRRRYGETFLESLPPAAMARGPGSQVVADLRRFFR